MQICQDTIIILHGWQSSKEKWQNVKQEIEKYCNDNNYNLKIIVPDLPGFKKETELSNTWDLDDYINWFKDFSFDFNQPFFLLGHSFGGRMAIKFAAENPEKLKGLILVSAAGIIHKKSVFYLKFLSLLKSLKFVFLKIPLIKNIFPILRNFFYRYILRKNDYIKAEKIPFLKKTFKNIIKENLRKSFPMIKVPTLIIWGEKDKLSPLSDAYIMNKEINNSKLEVLKNIGHSPHKDAITILADKIVNFIKIN